MAAVKAVRDECYGSASFGQVRTAIWRQGIFHDDLATGFVERNANFAVSIHFDRAKLSESTRSIPTFGVERTHLNGNAVGAKSLLSTRMITRVCQGRITGYIPGYNIAIAIDLDVRVKTGRVNAVPAIVVAGSEIIDFNNIRIGCDNVEGKGPDEVRLLTNDLIVDGHYTLT